VERQELKKLALDIDEGRVFGTWNVNPTDREIIPSIFMPLALGAELTEGAAHLYEYLTEALPRCINGYPIFTSFRTLTKEDTEAMLSMLKDIRKRKEEFLEEEQEDEDENEDMPEVRSRDEMPENRDDSSLRGRGVL